MFNIQGEQPKPDVLVTVSTRTAGVGERRAYDNFPWNLMPFQ